MKESITVPPIPSPFNMENENNTREDLFLPRTPLCDISNGPPIHMGPKKNSVKWKKLA